MLIVLFFNANKRAEVDWDKTEEDQGSLNNVLHLAT